MASGRNVLVTGANRGIGLELVRQLAERGDRPILAARNAAKGRAAAEALAADGLHAGSVGLDVADPDAPRRAAAEIAERDGRLDALVNNAAIHYDTWQRAAEADLDVVREALETNLLGAWRVTEAFLDLLRAAPSPRIVNVSSEAASLASMGPGAPAYNVSKAGLNALTVMLARELAPDGFLVNAVCPGWVATDMGGPGGGPVADGARSVLWAVDLSDGGPTGGFFRHGEPLPW